MKGVRSMHWKSLLVLALVAIPTTPLAGQTEARTREFRAQERAQERALRLAQENMIQARELQAEEAARAISLARESREQARVEAAAQREFALQRTQEELGRIQEYQAQALMEARANQRRNIEKLQQVIVRARDRAGVRLGVSLDPYQGKEYDAQGVLVKGVFDGSPARKAGVKEGDVITHLDGQSLTRPIPDEDDEDLDEYQSLPVQRLMALAGKLEDGQEVELRFTRDGDEETVNITASESGDEWFGLGLGDKGRGVYRLRPGGPGVYRFMTPGEEEIRMEVAPDLHGLRENLEDLHLELRDMDLDDLTSGGRGAWTIKGGPGRVFMKGWGGVYDDDFHFDVLSDVYVEGLELRKLNSELAEYFSTDRGVLVLRVEEDSRLGLRAGDVIQAIGHRDVEEPADVYRILSSYEDDEAVTFTVVRQGRETEVEGTAG